MRISFTNPGRESYVAALATSRLPATTRAVGVALASYADGKSVASPGVDALSKDTGLTGARVGQALRDLVIGGFAERSRHPLRGSRGAFDRYSLRVPVA